MDKDNLPAPTEGFLLTHFLTVHDVARSRSFYADVLGGHVVLEENPCIVKLANSWIIMDPGGGPTKDKPDVTLRPPSDPQTASRFINIRVADIASCYADWSAKGAEFLTEPIDREAELRCYMRDPDGYLIEVGQVVLLARIWEDKISRDHPELVDHLDAVMDTVAAPDHTEPDSLPDRTRFYRRCVGPSRWLMAVVSYEQQPARISTALANRKDPKRWKP